MAIIVEQAWDGDRLATDTGGTKYRVYGTTDKAAAFAALAAYVPATCGTLILQSAEVEIVDGTEDEWDGEVRYAVRDTAEPQTGDYNISFELGGGTAHITQSLQTWRYGIGVADPGDLKGVIGWNGEAVEGCDRIDQSFTFSETHYLPIATVTNAYVKNLAFLANPPHFNQSNWRVYAAGEVLFLGAAGSRRGNDDWEISFKFSVSPNVAGLVIGEITGIAKRGWDYLWVRYEETEDVAAKKLIPRPVGVYVEQVYYPGDFLSLGLGS